MVVAGRERFGVGHRVEPVRLAPPQHEVTAGVAGAVPEDHRDGVRSPPPPGAHGVFVAVHDPVPERRAHRAGDTLPDQGRVAGDGRVEGVPAVVGVAVELARDRVLEGAGYEAGLGEGGRGDGGDEGDCKGAPNWV